MRSDNHWRCAEMAWKLLWNKSTRMWNTIQGHCRKNNIVSFTIYALGNLTHVFRHAYCTEKKCQSLADFFLESLEETFPCEKAADNVMFQRNSNAMHHFRLEQVKEEPKNQLRKPGGSSWIQVHCSPDIWMPLGFVQTNVRDTYLFAS